MQPTGCLEKMNEAMTQHEQSPEQFPSAADEMRERWKLLSVVEQHQLLTEWLTDCLEADEEEELLNELQGIRQPTYPASAVSKIDLIQTRPDLVARILILSRDEMRRIANKVGESDMDGYWMAVGYVLDRFFRMKDAENSQAGNLDEH